MPLPERDARGAWQVVKRRWADLSLRGKSLVIIAIPLIALLGNSAVLLGVTASRRGAAAQVTHGTKVLAAASDRLAILVDAETGVRGYLASGDSVFLQPYDTALTHLPANAAAFANLATPVALPGRKKPSLR